MLIKLFKICIVTFVGYLLSQNPSDLAQSDGVQESQNMIDENDVEESDQFPSEVLTEIMEEKLERKGKYLGEVNDDESIYTIGAATTTRASNQSGFILSRNAAYQKAELRAKAEILRLSGINMTTERGLKSLEQFQDGIDPDLTKRATFLQKLLIAGDKGADAALKLLGTSQDEIDAMNAKEKDIALQEDFNEYIATVVSRVLAGCTTFKILEGDAGGDDYEIAVCVKYSPELRKLSAIVERDIEYVLDPRKAKESFSKIRNMSEEKLMFNLGSRVMFNNKGQMVVFGFGQTELRKSRGRKSAALRRAHDSAKLSAMANIKYFVAEDLSVENIKELIEKSRIYSDSTEASFQSERLEETIESKQSTIENLSVSTVRKWRAKHPISGDDVAGVVVAWSPDNAKKSRALRENLNAEVDLPGTEKNKKSKNRSKTKKSKYLGSDWDDEDDDL